MSKPRDLLRQHDAGFVEFARGLSDDQWSRPSLCTAWTNHDVLAHLVIGYRVSLATLTAGMVTHRGSFDRANATLATDLARRQSPGALIAEFAALTHHPRGIGRVFPRRLLLGDHVIHELDIAFAIGQDPAVGVEALVSVLNTQVRVPNPFVPAAKRARGLRLEATDADWDHGEGECTVVGRAAQLASVLAGRAWALNQLSGHGVGTLRQRLSAA
ncbi:putative Actinobacterial protein [Mycobacterium basiliense]|uniref:Putative Actinobacterial protein n=1 Tax=Mycobacterium basiliense TaxID=2094119 RepID=A0A447GGR6_9MYCO|nr:maleylpyruvate isomerase family mycothiol-dependent enzyme [Mycobacterium basiliense]VDM89686.1 putative Actinobacterial protein [Mycobacterium basiliense]